MDSLTQLALGAAVGEATLGHKVGRKAGILGAVLGTLPDLDVLIPMGSDVADFTYHRSYSHSLIVLGLLTPIVVWLIRKYSKDASVSSKHWAFMVYAVFATHVLLDSFTIYGTQIFWPLPIAPMSWSTIFIIDPHFTVPLLVGLGAVFFLKKREALGRHINHLCLALSLLYLGWALTAKLAVTQIAESDLKEQGIEFTQLVAQPGPFNTILWRVLAMAEGGYYEGWFSLRRNERPIQLVFYPSSPELLEPVQQHWPVQRLQWFTHGYYRVRQMDKNIIITDLRMGAEDQYVFNFKVAEKRNGSVVPSEDRFIRQSTSLSKVKDILNKI